MRERLKGGKKQMERREKVVRVEERKERCEGN